MARGFLHSSSINATKDGREWLQSLEGGIKKTPSAPVRPALNVMIGRRNLNHSLQKLLDVGLRREPQRLPCLVGFPEFAAVEMIHARREVGDEIGLGHGAQCSVLGTRCSVLGTRCSVLY